jgi:hypothetical protein
MKVVASCRGTAIADDRLRTRVINVRPVCKGGLRGFVVTEMLFGVRIRDVDNKEDPSIRHERGKVTYAEVVERTSKKLREAFFEYLAEIVRQQHHDAFGDGGAQ